MKAINSKSKIKILWKIWRGVNKISEDFNSLNTNLKVFLVGGCDTYAMSHVINREVEPGYDVIEIDVYPNTLGEGAYNVKALWTKNQGRDVLTSMRSGVFGITSNVEEAEVKDEEIRLVSMVESYGRDGMSAYEIAVFRGVEASSEKEWVAMENNFIRNEAERVKAEEERAERFDSSEAERSDNFSISQKRRQDDYTAAESVRDATFQTNEAAREDEFSEAIQAAKDNLVVVNDLTTGGADKALSAEMGRRINSRFNGSTTDIPSSDYTKIDGCYLSNGSIGSTSNYWHSSPLRLLKGETISMEMQYNYTSQAIAIVDRDGNWIKEAVKGKQEVKVYEYTANEDCYVSVGYLKSGELYRELTSLTITTLGLEGKVNAVVGEIDEVKAAQQEQQAQIASTSEQLIQHSTALAEHATNISANAQQIEELREKQVEDSEKLAEHEQQLESFNSSTRDIPSSDYTKLDGMFNASGSITGASSYWHSSPIRLLNGETIKMVRAIHSPTQAIALVDRDGNWLEHVVPAVSGVMEYEYTATEDCYVSVSYLRSGDGYRELISLTITSPGLADKVDIVEAEITDVKAAQQEQQAQIASTSEQLIQHSTALAEHATNISANAQQIEELREKQVEDSEKLAEHEQQLESFNSSTRDIPSSDYTKLDGMFNASGSITGASSYWHSSPIRLLNGETIKMVRAIHSPTQAIALVDRDGNWLEHVVPAVSGVMEYEYTATEDCYVSVSYLRSGDGYRELISLTITSPGLADKVDIVEAEITDVKAAQQEQQAQIASMSEKLDVIAYVVTDIPPSSYDKLDGDVNASGSIVAPASYWHSSPIALANGETIHMATQLRGAMAIAETDASSTFYKSLIRHDDSKEYYYTATRDMYISVGYLKASETTYREITTLEKLTPSDLERQLANKPYSLDLPDYTREDYRCDNLYKSEDDANINAAIFEQYKMRDEVKAMTDDDILVQGDCGYYENVDGSITHGTIKWKIFRNGILYIHGYGKMYDFIKGVSGCKTIAEVNDTVQRMGEHYWYYGFVEPNVNGITGPFDKSKYHYNDYDDVIAYSVKRYPENGETINPINNMPYGYGAPWYIYRSEVSYNDNRYIADIPYVSDSEYNHLNPNGYKYSRVCIDEDISQGGITYIGNWAFYRCCADSIVLPSMVERIGCWGVRYSPTIRTVVMYDKVTEIEDHGVSRNLSAVTIRLSTALASIGSYGLSGNPLVKHIDMPNVSVVGDSMFQGDSCLEKVNVGSLTDIPNFFAVSCANLTRFVIPSGVTRIGRQSLSGNTLREIVIPSTVTDIGEAAFALVKADKVVIDSESISSSIESLTDYGQLVLAGNKILIPVGNEVSNFFRSRYYLEGEYEGYNVYVGW